MNQRLRMHAPGFSFIEIMAAVLILGLILAVSVPVYFNYVAGARVRSTTANLKVIKNTLNLYSMEHGKYPAKLIDLVERPKGETDKAWRPYLEKLPLDAWGNEFVYKILPSGSKHPFDLYSYGPNGPDQSTAEERISVWD
jgi:general secretion pathway protein G